jgi:hypothetical protein
LHTAAAALTLAAPGTANSVLAPGAANYFAHITQYLASWQLMYYGSPCRPRLLPRRQLLASAAMVICGAASFCVFAIKRLRFRQVKI